MAEDRTNLSSLPQWAQPLSHKPDPNRVGSLQTVKGGEFVQRRSEAQLPADPATAHPARLAPTGEARVADPQSTPAEPSYYDITMLKPPLWAWEIAAYFYLGGISAGAYLLSRMAERVGGREFEAVSRVGSYVSLATLLPCPPLLIHDLGDPKRFHHMLRVWKPTSPMNLGTWAISAFGGAAAADALRHYLDSRGPLSRAENSRISRLMNNRTLLMAHDAAGVPLALVVASYTGVLLSCTANPLWSKNSWLAPLFVASAVSTAAEAISLTMDAVGERGRGAEAGQRVLKNVDSVAHAVEGVCMAGFLRQSGEKAEVLHTGKVSKYHHLSIGAIVAAEVIKRLPLPALLARPARMLTAILGLTGGFSLRWAMVFGGKEAAADPHTARLVSQPETSLTR